MFYRDKEMTAGQTSIRELPLLEGERIEEQFSPDSGLDPETPWKGQLLVLTNQRVISFVEDNSHRQTLLAPIGELKGVSVKANTKGFKDLIQGLGMMFIGILCYLVLGYILDGISIALALGSAIAFVGVLFIAKYLFWEEEGSVTFQGGSWELCFPYKSNRASADVYNLINRFFQLKLDPIAHPAPLKVEPEVKPLRQSFSPPPRDYSSPHPRDFSHDI